MAKNVGKWVAMIRCQTCNSIKQLKKYAEIGRRKEFEDKGIIEEDGEKKPCPYYCEKGWFHSSGTLSS